jgi:hypothetical protein
VEKWREKNYQNFAYLFKNMIKPKLNMNNHAMIPNKIQFFFVSIRNLRWPSPHGKYNIINSNFITDVAECSADTKTNSVVPIAVGAALAALVVIVLIAYLIGRKRSRQSGYEQV